MRNFIVNDLIDQGLVKIKWYDNGLGVVKYNNKVFYNNLWNTDSRLLDCRGTVIDKDFNIVSMPFTKVFNYKENGTLVGLDMNIVAPRKVNGFMAAATVSNGKLIVSTTGTLDSEYAVIAKKHIGNHIFYTGQTYLFEICDKTDPHIVDEQEGAYLIGCRPNYIGSRLFSESDLDLIANKYGFLRPEWSQTTFSELLETVNMVRHEGFMVRCAESGQTLCKIKSPYYLAKKFFMRMSDKKIEQIYSDDIEGLKKIIDEEYYPLFNFIKTLDKEYWMSLNSGQRKEIIEEFLCQH